MIWVRYGSATTPTPDLRAAAGLVWYRSSRSSRRHHGRRPGQNASLGRRPRCPPPDRPLNTGIGPLAVPPPPDAPMTVPRSAGQHRRQPDHGPATRRRRHRRAATCPDHCRPLSRGHAPRRLPPWIATGRHEAICTASHDLLESESPSSSRTDREYCARHHIAGSVTTFSSSACSVSLCRLSHPEAAHEKRRLHKPAS